MGANPGLERRIACIAKRIAGADEQAGSAAELAGKLFRMCDPSTDRTGCWSFELPNGMVFCVEWEGGEDEYDVPVEAITSRTDAMGAAYGVYFCDDGMLPHVSVGIDMQEASSIAASIIRCAEEYRFDGAEDAFAFVDECFGGPFGALLDERIVEDAETPYEMPLTNRDVVAWAKDHPRELMAALNDNLPGHDIGETPFCALHDIYRRYLDTPQKYYGFDPSRQALFENMCDCLVHGYGIGRSGWESEGVSRREAYDLWDKATHCMGDWD